MPGAVIGKALNLGYPGNVSRSADAIIDNRVVKSTDAAGINFGDPAILNPDNTYSKFGTTSSLLTAALVSTTAYTSLAVQALTDNLNAGESVLLVSGANTQTATLSAPAAVGATSLSINSITANFSYPIGSNVYVSNIPAQFAGVGVREVKQGVNYTGNGQGTYAPGEAADVIGRGTVIVTCNVGTPTAGGPVYLRIIANGAIPLGIVGGFEAAADGTNTVLLTNAKWSTGRIDANKSAEVTILSRILP
jgi:hypothetical protein